MEKSIEDFYRRCSPYCFKRMSDGRYLALNREYLPLDQSRADVGGHLEQSNYNTLLEVAHKELGIVLTPQEISLLKHGGNENDEFFLYDDGCLPWKGKKYMDAYDKKVESIPKVARLA